MSILDGIRYRKVQELCSCRLKKFAEHDCKIHDLAFEERGYTWHYWFRYPAKADPRGHRFVPIKCLLCGYESIEGQVVYRTCQKREVE